jgi:hypothetical protein
MRYTFQVHDFFNRTTGFTDRKITGPMTRRTAALCFALGFASTQNVVQQCRTAEIIKQVTIRVSYIG